MCSRKIALGSYIMPLQLGMAAVFLTNILHGVGRAYNFDRAFLPCWRPECAFPFMVEVREEFFNVFAANGKTCSGGKGNIQATQETPMGMIEL